MHWLDKNVHLPIQSMKLLVLTRNFGTFIIVKSWILYHMVFCMVLHRIVSYCNIWVTIETLHWIRHMLHRKFGIVLLAKFLNVKLFHHRLNFLKVSNRLKISHRLLNETNECRKLGTAYQQSSET